MKVIWIKTDTLMVSLVMPIVKILTRYLKTKIKWIRYSDLRAQHWFSSFMMWTNFSTTLIFIIYITVYSIALDLTSPVFCNFVMHTKLHFCLYQLIIDWLIDRLLFNYWPPMPSFSSASWNCWKHGTKKLNFFTN